MEVVRLGHLEHPQVDERVLVPGEPDEAQLALFFRFENPRHRAVLAEDLIRVFHADDLVVLHEVEPVGLEAGKRFLDLAHGGLLGAAVDLGHLEHFIAVAVLQRLAGAQFAGAQVVVPGVVHERDAAVDGAAHQFDRFLLGGDLAEVESAHADEGNHLARAAERTVDHVALALLALHRAVEQGQIVGGGDQGVDRVGLVGSVGLGAAGANEGAGGREPGGDGGGGFQEGAAGGVHGGKQVERRCLQAKTKVPGAGDARFSAPGEPP